MSLYLLFANMAYEVLLCPVFSFVFLFRININYNN